MFLFARENLRLLMNFSNREAENLAQSNSLSTSPKRVLKICLSMSLMAKSMTWVAKILQFHPKSHMQLTQGFVFSMSHSTILCRNVESKERADGVEKLLISGLPDLEVSARR